MINDEHTLCFMIGNIMRQHRKFSLKHIKTSILDSINDSVIRSMMIFNFVHKLNCNQKPLKVIAEYFYDKLSTQYLIKIKNLSLRSKIQNLLQDATKNGDISLMFEILQSKEIDDKNAIYFKKLQKVARWQSKIQQYNKNIADSKNINAMARNGAVKVAGYVFLSTIFIIFYNLFWLDK
jgi:hypothetical protein